MRPAILILAVALAACRTQPLGVSSDGGGMTADDGVYAAESLPTALNRISITKVSAARDLCFSVLLVNPDTTNAFGITLPPKWSIQGAWVSRPAKSCTVFLAPSGGLNAAKGMGTITFDKADFPCTITLDATLVFPTNTSNYPTVEELDAAQVTVPGVCK